MRLLPRAIWRLLCAGVLLGPQAAGAQSDLQPWLAFVGCWSDAERPTRTTPVLCVLPVEGDPLSADLATFVGGNEASRSRLQADGTRQPFAVERCSGYESTRFSNDGLRVYLRSEIDCSGAPAARSSGVLAITEASSLVYAFGQDGEVPVADLRVYARVADGDLPRALRPGLAVAGSESNPHREALAPKQVDPSDLQDVAQAVNPAVAELWFGAMAIVSSDLAVIADETRAQLETAGVPARVARAAYALSRPSSYDVQLTFHGASIATWQDDVGTAEFIRALRVLGRQGAVLLAEGLGPDAPQEQLSCGLLLSSVVVASEVGPTVPFILPAEPTRFGADARCAAPAFLAGAESAEELYAVGVADLAPNAVGYVWRAPLASRASRDGGQTLYTRGMRDSDERRFWDGQRYLPQSPQPNGTKPIPGPFIPRVADPEQRRRAPMFDPLAGWQTEGTLTSLPKPDVP